MTPKARVRKAFPKSYHVSSYFVVPSYHHIFSTTESGATKLGEGTSEDEAWAAAERTVSPQRERLK